MVEPDGIDLKDVKRRMEGAIDVLREEFAGLRTGRASAGLLDPIMVEAYGTPMPLNQVATITVPEARMLSVQVWDKALVQPVEKAIRQSSLGLNPMTEGQSLRIPLPDLSEDRRKELTKVAHQYAEQAKVAVRNVRRDGMDTLKKLQKSSDISEDVQHNTGDALQKATDEAIKEIDVVLEAKDADIMKV